MDIDLTTLTTRVRTAAYVLNLMEECDLPTAAVIGQRYYTRALRLELGEHIPDNETYDPTADNIVERIA